MAGRAFHILVPGSKDMGWHAVFNLGRAPLNKRLIAFQAEAERPELAIKVKGINELLHLLLRYLTGNQNGIELPAGDQTPFHNLPVFGQYDSSLRPGFGDHLGVIAAIKEQGIIAHQPQPFSQLAYIVINDKPRFANGTASSNFLQVDEHPFLSQ